MSVKIGFAVLSHNEPGQLLRLVTTLTAMFDAPPIVCHHDFDHCPLSEAPFPPNVRFVHPHIRTRWGHITLPLAALRAFSLLREDDQPDWFILLGGSDYPVRPADEIIADLSDTHYDAYLDHREIPCGVVPPDQSPQIGGFERPQWISRAYDRYCTCRWWWPRLSKTSQPSDLFPFQKNQIYFRNPFMSRWLQFNRPSRIYGGAFWFEANRKAMDRLLDNPSTPNLIRYYGPREIPDESLFHTMLCNEPDLRICKDNKRYEDWTRGEPHPKWLEASDTPKILASGAHFARKFRPDGVAQEFIKQTVLHLGPDRIPRTRQKIAS